MYTQCPYCQTIFRVVAAHLNVAQGYVHCSCCKQVFNATNYLIQQLPKNTNLTPVVEKKVFDERENIDFENDENFQDEDIPELLKDDIYEPDDERSWGSFLTSSIMVILFIAVLAGQITWYWQRDMVLQHPQIRPWLDVFCEAMLCQLPETRNLTSFQAENHNIQPHPEIEDAVQFEAVFVNNAFFAQPYPILELTFEDFTGKNIAQRFFKPTEYLPKSQENQQMLPQAAVHIKFDLIEINNDITGYHFDFF